MSGGNQPIIIKKVIQGGHGHHGGSWKVAYADFMTSMLALFIVLWVIGQSKQTRMAIAEYFKDPSKTPAEIVALIQDEKSKNKKPAPDPSLPPIDAQDKQRLEMLEKKLLNSLKNMKTDEGNRLSVNVEWTDQGLRITLLDRDKAPFFDVGSPSPKTHTCRVLRRIGQELSGVPNPVIIEGHTDRRQFTQGHYGNWELSTERGNAARRLLLSGGMNPRAVHEVRGYADTRLMHPKDPFDPENRRVSILVRYLGRPDEDKDALAKKIGKTQRVGESEPKAPAGGPAPTAKGHAEAPASPAHEGSPAAAEDSVSGAEGGEAGASASGAPAPTSDGAGSGAPVEGAGH